MPVIFFLLQPEGAMAGRENFQWGAIVRDLATLRTGFSPAIQQCTARTMNGFNAVPGCARTCATPSSVPPIYCRAQELFT